MLAVVPQGNPARTVRDDHLHARPQGGALIELEGRTVVVAGSTSADTLASVKAVVAQAKREGVPVTLIGQPQDLPAGLSSEIESFPLGVSCSCAGGFGTEIGNILDIQRRGGLGHMDSDKKPVYIIATPADTGASAYSLIGQVAAVVAAKNGGQEVVVAAPYRAIDEALDDPSVSLLLRCLARHLVSQDGVFERLEEEKTSATFTRESAAFVLRMRADAPDAEQAAMECGLGIERVEYGQQGGPDEGLLLVQIKIPTYSSPQERAALEAALNTFKARMGAPDIRPATITKLLAHYPNKEALAAVLDTGVAPSATVYGDLALRRFFAANDVRNTGLLSEDAKGALTGDVKSALVRTRDAFVKYRQEYGELLLEQLPSTNDPTFKDLLCRRLIELGCTILMLEQTYRAGGVNNEGFLQPLKGAGPENLIVTGLKILTTPLPAKSFDDFRPVREALQMIASSNDLNAQFNRMLVDSGALPSS